MTYPLAAILAKVAAGGFLFAPWLAKHPYKGSPVQPYGAFCTLKQAIPRSRTSRFGAPDGLYRAAIPPLAQSPAAEGVAPLRAGGEATLQTAHVKRRSRIAYPFNF